MVQITQKRCRLFLQDENLKSFDNIKPDLLKATETTLRLAKPGQQYVILYDASYYSSGFVSMIEDYLEQKHRKKANLRTCILRITII